MDKSRDYRIPCEDCVVEFDGGTFDGPKAYVIFCPLHRNADLLASTLRVVLNGFLPGNADPGKQMMEGFITKALEAAGQPLKLSPSAPVGAPSGSPVAPGANLQEGAAKQSA